MKQNRTAPAKEFSRVLPVILNTILVVMFSVTLFSGIASADSLTGREWHVSFAGDNENRLVSSFDDFQDGFADSVRQLQPGDDITFTIYLDNENSQTADWYMTNQVISSLEDSKEAARGGGYSYLLTYEGNTRRTLYDSNTVGGDTGAGAEGLRGATSALRDYLYLDTLLQGQSGMVKLTVALDGETQGNTYMNSLANLMMNFAIEINSGTVPQPTNAETPVNPANQVTPAKPANASNPTTQANTAPRTVVKTGDNSSLLTLYLIMAASGVLFLILAIISVRSRKKEKEAKR